MNKAQWNEAERVRKIKRALYMRGYRELKKIKRGEKTPIGILEKLCKELGIRPMDTPIMKLEKLKTKKKGIKL